MTPLAAALFLALAALVRSQETTAPAEESPYESCTPAEIAQIREALVPARTRTQAAQARAAGLIGSGTERDSRTRDVERAQTMVAGLFGMDRASVDGTVLGRVSEVLRGMTRALSLPGLRFRCEPAGAEACDGLLGAFVRGRSRPFRIHLCRDFFATTGSLPPLERRIRFLVHESAHLAGVGLSSRDEGYCPYFICTGTCGPAGVDGLTVADNWGQFVYCLSGQPPEAGDSIRAPD